MYTYEEVVEKINQARRFGKEKGVDVTAKVLEKLNHPQKKIPYIHVAGTNGKGSTCAFLTAMLRQAGYKVGTFISPHLIEFEERIRMNDAYIPKEKVREYGNFLFSTDFGVELTMFDYCLVMAVLFFSDEACDVAVIETGLGGTFDSTNALGTPVATVITRIGFYHMSILGNTLGEIAGQKAGILRKDVPLVLGLQEKEARESILSCADKVGSTPVVEVTAEDLEEVKKIGPGLLGEYQYENGALAMLTARCLKLDEEAVRTGIRQANWMGRMEILSRKPFLLVDGAHNSNGVAALISSLEGLYPGEKFHFIMGVMADKDYPEMIEKILPFASDFVTVTPESSRALQARELAECIAQKGIDVKSVSSVEEALDTMEESYKTVVFGSLYFIGEVEEYWKNRKL